MYHMFDRAHPSRTFGRRNAGLADNQIGLLIGERCCEGRFGAAKFFSCRAAAN
jgi:hypothetical protein